MCGCLLCAPYWGLAHNPGMCPDWKWNCPPFGLQTGAQSTEPQQPGLGAVFLTGFQVFPVWGDSSEDASLVAGVRWTREERA